MAKLTKFDIVEFEAHSNNVTIRKSEKGKYTFSDYAEQYAKERIIEELEKCSCSCGEVEEEDYVCYRCKRIKELKEVKQ